MRQRAAGAHGHVFAGANLRANQIQLLDKVVNRLTEHGCSLRVVRYRQNEPLRDFQRGQS